MGHFGGSVDGSASILATLLITLLIISMLCAARFKSKFIPESGITLLVGIAAGMIIKLVLATDPKSPSLMSDLINFNPIIFLVIQLPPIIFNSGFNIDTGLLGQYFRAIFLFAVVGTTISATFITFFLWFVPTEILDLSLAELATFGALISATDPVSTLSVFSEKRVNLQLFYLVFGESVVNDAVGLVLFDTASQIVSHPEQTFNFGESALNLLFVFAASFLLGILMAIFFALIFKYAKFSHKQQLIELSIFVTIIYFPFVIAEICGVSGIVTLLVTAICSQRYVLPNLSLRTVLEAEALFRMIAHLCEISVFLILGMSVFSLFEIVTPDFKFLFWVLLACVIGRAIQVYVLTCLYNFWLKSPHSRKIKTRHAHMMNVGGLRGAVAFACASNFPNQNDNRNDILLITMFVCLTSIFCLGGVTDLALEKLHIETDVDEEEFLDEIDIKIAKETPNAVSAAARKLFSLVDKLTLSEEDISRKSIHSGSLTEIWNLHHRSIGKNLNELNEGGGDGGGEESEAEQPPPTTPLQEKLLEHHVNVNENNVYISSGGGGTTDDENLNLNDTVNYFSGPELSTNNNNKNNNDKYASASQNGRQQPSSNRPASKRRKRKKSLYDFGRNNLAFQKSPLDSSRRNSLKTDWVDIRLPTTTNNSETTSRSARSVSNIA